MSLFGFSYQCDDGFSGFKETFQANSEEDVLNFILESIQNYLAELQEYEKQHGRVPIWGREFHNFENKKGEKYFDMISRANWHRIFNIPYDYSNTALKNFMKDATIEDLTEIINESFVDGDSHFQITLYKIEVTVDLTN